MFLPDGTVVDDQRSIVSIDQRAIRSIITIDRCQDWSRARAEGGPAMQRYRDWYFGFIAGAEQNPERAPSRHGVTHEDMMKRIDAGCEYLPLANLIERREKMMTNHISLIAACTLAISINTVARAQTPSESNQRETEQSYISLPNGLGLERCSIWTAAVAQGGDTEARTVNWSDGYLSGVQFYPFSTGSNGMSGEEVHALVPRIRDGVAAICAENPEKRVLDAMQESVAVVERAVSDEWAARHPVDPDVPLQRDILLLRTTTFGVGGDTCAERTAALATGGATQERYADWLAGYLSGLRFYVTRDDDPRLPEYYDIAERLDAECIARPDSVLFSAVSGALSARASGK